MAAYGGRADLMDRVAPLGPVYQAGTLSGNPLAMSAGIATLDLLAAPGFYESLGARAKRLRRRYRRGSERKRDTGYRGARRSRCSPCFFRANPCA